MEQIVIINNHDYLGKLYAPKYKQRRSEMKRKSRRKIEMKISKSEDKINNQYINVQDARNNALQ